MPLAGADPLAPLARDIARSMTEAGLTLHHCARHDPLYRLGGVCLLAVPPGRDGRGGIAVSLDRAQPAAAGLGQVRHLPGTQQAMNTALGGVLRAFGYLVTPFGSRRRLARHRPPRRGRERAVTALAAPDTGTGYVPAVTAGVDRAIRVSTAVAVLAVAGIAAYVSYWHAYAVVCAHGETGVTARLEPATIDGLVYASSMVILYAARHRLPVPALARWLLALGIVATLAANMAQGWSHGPVGAAIAAWPAVSLVGSYELLVWIIRTAAAGGPDHVPAADHRRPMADHAGPVLRYGLLSGLTRTGDDPQVPACPERADPRTTAGPGGPDQPRTRLDRRRTTRSPDGGGPGGPGLRARCLPPAPERRHQRRRSGRLPCQRPGRAGRYPSASSRRCSARPPAAGHATGWPKPGRARYRSERAALQPNTKPPTEGAGGTSLCRKTHADRRGTWSASMETSVCSRSSPVMTPPRPSSLHLSRRLVVLEGSQPAQLVGLAALSAFAIRPVPTALLAANPDGRKPERGVGAQYVGPVCWSAFPEREGQADQPDQRRD